MPVIETKGAASSGGFGQFARQVAANYIEDVFSTWLYTGTISAQTINNGIDLSTKGGLVWIKNRGSTADNVLFDTARGEFKSLASNSTAAQYSSGSTYGVTSFNVNGFSVGTAYETPFNANGNTYASWTFRKQAKFFDVVTYTGNGSGVRTIPHNLGSTPGVAILKKTSTTSDWIVTDPGGAWGSYGGQPLYLNNTNAKEGFNQTGVFSADATSIYVGADSFYTGTNFGSNDSGVTYVAYLFAHNAGGFGAAGTDNVITCGSYTGNGGSLSVNLGHEAQWVLIKRSDAAGSWLIVDNMRAMSETSTLYLYPTYSFSEQNPGTSVVKATSTGFNLPISSLYNGNGATYIYIAIRRGPMRTPTSGTSVFALSQWVGANQNQDMGTQTASFGTGFMSILKNRNTAQTNGVFSNLIGSQPFLWTSGTNAESTDPGGFSVVNNRLQLNQTSYFGAGGDGSGSNYIGWHFRRAPGFFDVVCYTGNGTTLTANHNLGVVPEMMIIKRRDTSGNWSVYTATTGVNKVIELNEAYGAQTASYWGTGPTATTFQVQSNVNTGNKFVAYLFASCPGVSKVGSYTGTGTTQQINCGFTGGARFVLIKRTDDNSSGTANWFVWDSARGIVAGDDPYLLLNSTAAEVTNTDYIDTLSTGFEISSTAPAAINANGGSYIFLAIA